MKLKPAISALIIALATSSAAQTPARPLRIGFLSNFTEAGGRETVGCFKSALAKYGWAEGKTVNYEHRWAEGRGERYPALAAELAAMDLDLIAVNSTPASQAIRKATTGKDVPVVFMSVSDLVESGVVASLGRPGGNITGVSNFFPGMAGKLVEHLKELQPNLTRALVIRDAANAGKALDAKEIQSSGHKMGVEVIDGGVRNAADIRQRFADLPEARPGALIVLVDGVTLSSKELMLGLVRNSGLPAIYQVRDFVDAGGLMSYGLNFCQHFAHAASHANSVLRGTKPADIPVELPTTFELVINTKAAQALGLTVPSMLMAGANEVLE